MVLVGSRIGAPRSIVTSRAIRTFSPTPTSARSRSPWRFASVAMPGSQARGVSSTRARHARGVWGARRSSAQTLRQSVHAHRVPTQGPGSPSSRDPWTPGRPTTAFILFRMVHEQEGAPSMPRFRVVASAALIVLALVGSACTSTGDGSGGGAGDAAAAATAAASFDVSLTDQLKIDPAMIDAPSNTPLTFERHQHRRGTAFVRRRGGRPDLSDAAAGWWRHRHARGSGATRRRLHHAVHGPGSRRRRDEGHADGLRRRPPPPAPAVRRRR